MPIIAALCAAYPERLGSGVLYASGVTGCDDDGSP